MNDTERELNMRSKSKRSRHFIFAIGILVMAVFISGMVGAQSKQSQASAGLPSDLFVKALPDNPVDVGEARKTAQQGQQIVLRGRIGGMPNPFADRYAISGSLGFEAALVCREVRHTVGLLLHSTRENPGECGHGSSCGRERETSQRFC